MAEKEGTGTDLRSDLSPEKKFPSYVLYKYEIDRTTNASSSSADELKGKDSGTEPKKNAFSLSVVTSGLGDVQEEEFRKFMIKRITKAGVYGKGGHISGLDLGSSGQLLCYYSLLRGDAIADNQSSSPTPESPTGASTLNSNEYLICLIAPPDAVLDLFRPELDKFCGKLLSLLDADPVLRYDLEDSDQLSTLASNIQPYLKEWFSETTEYLCRSVKLLSDSVKYVIHAALMDTDIDISGANEKQVADIKRFAECCSLADLINNHTASTPSSDSGNQGNLLVDISVSDPSGNPISASIKPSFKFTIENDTCVAGQTDCTRFCEDWSSKLLVGDCENAVFLRQVIDNYKLKAIQDMNNLKRLLRQAETDHYSLFRCYVFLKNCGNAAVLLQHVPTELSSVDTADAINIINVLKEFVDDQERTES